MILFHICAVVRLALKDSTQLKDFRHIVSNMKRIHFTNFGF
nr:MAG TPA: hypothetical protein [Caudoviricetes sp.]